MPDAPTKPTEIPRYQRISKDVKTVVLAKILQELQSAPTLQTLLHNVYRMVREEFDSVGVLVSIYDSYREELVYYSQGEATEPTSYVLKLGHGLAGKVGASQSPQRTENLSDFPILPDSSGPWNPQSTCHGRSACPSWNSIGSD